MAIYPRDGRSDKALMKPADKAMYAAKNSRAIADGRKNQIRQGTL